MPLLHLEPLSRHVTKSDLLTFLEQIGGVERRRIGRIELQGRQAIIEIPDQWDVRLVQALDGQKLGERRVRAWASEGGTGAGQTSAASTMPLGPARNSEEEDHFQRLARLLELESRAEAQEAAERGRRLSPEAAEQSGNSLVDMEILDEDTGLGGRVLVQLVKRKRGPLPWTRLGIGSPVVLSPAVTSGNSAAATGRSREDRHRRHPRQAEEDCRGVVFARDETCLRVALASLPDEMRDCDAWRVDLAYDEIAVQRQRAALQRARTARGDRVAELREVLLGRRCPEFSPELAEPALDASLNETQLAAVRFALSARDVALLHGPPGTGKTTTVVEFIRRAVRRGWRVLACAPSNLAVDNIFERLLNAGERAVRIGHPARVLPELRAHTLDMLVDDHPDVRLARKLVKEAWSLFRQANRFTRARPEPGSRQETRQEAKSLLADARRLESQAAEHILDTAHILCATTTGLDSELLGTRRFDLAVIDEACQSIEPGCWIPLLRSERIVLAGDHCQLPPTVISREAQAEGLGVSIFERLMSLYGAPLARRLTVQYRMHTAIMDFSSAEFYEAELEAAPAVRGHLLADLPGVRAEPLTQTPVEFCDTAGAGFDEEEEPDGESRLNPQEAALLCRRVQELQAAGVAADAIGVITPYAAQVRCLRELLPIPHLEIDSVDGFQGREKEAILISLTRSNPRGEIGFLADIRRMNVALTRARRKLIVIGDSATLSRHPFFGRLVEYFEQIGAYRTVWE